MEEKRRDQPSLPEGATSLMNIFSPPTNYSIENSKKEEKKFISADDEQLSTERTDNVKKNGSDFIGDYSPMNRKTEETSLLPNLHYSYKTPLNDFFTREDETDELKNRKDCIKNSIFRFSMKSFARSILNDWCSFEFIRTFLIGSITFSLYHIVFTLACASAISRPHQPNQYSILGPMARMGALGPIVNAPLLIPILNDEFPALYPCLDLFIAPFVSTMARQIDQSLFEQGIEDPNDTIFLATFSVLNGLALLLSAFLCILASQVKLANFGAFLPYPVICGFFSAIGVLIWLLAFNVDTNGLTITRLIESGDLSLVSNALLHHVPSFVLGTALFYLREKNAMYMIIMLFSSIFGTYLIMFLTGTSLEYAQNEKWFWDAKSFETNEEVSLFHFAPPAPFGVIGVLWGNNINIMALVSGLKTACAMAFIYTLRCSILPPAMKKNTQVMVASRKEAMEQMPNLNSSNTMRLSLTPRPVKNKKQPDILTVLLWIGNSQILSAISGSFAVVPCTGAAITLYKMRAGNEAPQYGSALILLYFFISDFKFISYIPKLVFSSLLVNTFLDLIILFFIRSFLKAKQKWEFLVVPLIIILTQVIGMLLSIAVGVAFSTIIFVASFYRTGVVKFIGNGLTVRSTVERIGSESLWLDQNGDLIQVLVLQNYLFFGNSASCVNYVQSMFEEPEVDIISFPLPPIPKILVLDFTHVTGMDTSAVDVFNDIIALCRANSCKVLLSGLLPSLRSAMTIEGENNLTDKQLRFFPDLESALGKSEDIILKSVHNAKGKEVEHSMIRTRKRLMSKDNEDDDGFSYSLEQIDKQHGISFCERLVMLKEFTTPMELTPGQDLFDPDTCNPEKRGLFFIEFGTMLYSNHPTPCHVLFLWSNLLHLRSN